MCVWVDAELPAHEGLRFVLHAGDLCRGRRVLALRLCPETFGAVAGAPIELVLQLPVESGLHEQHLTLAFELGNEALSFLGERAAIEKKSSTGRSSRFAARRNAAGAESES
jgi:hypothetical protein